MSAIDRSFIKVFAEPSRPEPDRLPAAPHTAAIYNGHAARDSRAAADFLAAIASLAQISASGSPTGTAAATSNSIRFDPAPAAVPAMNGSATTPEVVAAQPTSLNPVSPESVQFAAASGRLDPTNRDTNSVTTNHRFNPAHPGAAMGPHWDPALTPSLAVSTRSIEPEISTTSAERSVESPLAATIDRSPEQTRHAAFAQPAFEVDRFDKPAVCQRLVEAAADGVRTTAGRICNAAVRGQNVVLVTGYHRGEGRTTTSICLASELAAMNKSVVIVDANFESPTLAKTVGISPQLGWEDSILDGTPISDMMIESLGDGYTILPLTAGTTPHFDWTIDSKLPMVLEMVRDHFDVVLVDGMPTEAFGHSATVLDSIGPFVDSAIVMHTELDDAGEALSRVVSQLLRAGIEPLGVVRNAPPTRAIA